MGIIKKQGIQGTISLYIGVFIGFIINSILLPNILSEEEVGLIHTLLAYSTVFAQFSTLGFMSVVTRLFSYFRDKDNKHNGFFFILLSVCFVGTIVVFILFFLLKETIIRQNIENSSLFIRYINYLIPFSVFTLIFYQLDNYYAVLFKAVRGLILKEIVQRVIVLFVLSVFYFEYIDIGGFVVGYTLAIAIPALALILILILDGEFIVRPKLDYISKDMSKSMISVSFFGILSALVASASIQIDKAMSTSMLSLQITGIYATVAIFAGFIKTPSKALLKISAAIIAEAWKRNDTNEINKIYKETCFNLFIIAVFVYAGIIGNIDNVFILLPDEYIIGKFSIFILGLAYIIEMSSGAANNILATSIYYKYLTWLVAIMLILSVILNYILIPLYGIDGVALATGISIVLFTLLKIIYIYRKLNMYPYSLKYFVVLGIAITSCFLSGLLPVLSNFIIDILVRSSIIIVIFVGLLVLLRVSAELNRIIETIFIMIKRYLEKKL